MIQGHNPGKVAGYGMAADNNGGVLVTGAFEGALLYGTQVLQSQGGLDVFVLKINTHGEIVWAIRAGGPGQDSGNSIGVHRDGHVYVTGSFSGRANFNGFPLESDGDLDIFWMKMGRQISM